MYDVIALGELLIDFTPSGSSPTGMRLFEQNPGGAPANVLCALSNLGRRTGFIGKVGADMHGEFLRQVLEEKGVDTRGLVSDPDAFTTLAFVALSDKGERSFSFARKPGADTCLRSDELNMDLLQQCRIFHFGSLSLTDEPSRSATIAAIQAAKEAGAVISYDPNYRAPLWPDREAAVYGMRSVLKLVDIIKMSDEETYLLTGKEPYVEAATAFMREGIGCVVVTLGKNGAYAANRQGSCQLLPPDAPVVDTTGAGDAFWGGFLHMLLEDDGKPSKFSETRRDCTRFANAVATLCVQKRGAIPALPTFAEVSRFLSQ